MDIKELNKRVKKAIDLDQKFEIACSSAAELIKEVADFELHVGPVGGDGVVVMNYVTSDVALLIDCSEVIKKTGTLTEDQHQELTF